MEDVRRTLLRIQTPEKSNIIKVDILLSGQVRLRYEESPALDIVTDTLEDLMLEAALHPALDSETYEQLYWELDLLGLRGN